MIPPMAINVNDPTQFEQIVVSCSDRAGSFLPVPIEIQVIQAFMT